MTADEPAAPRSLHASMIEAAQKIGPVAKNLQNADSHYNARSIDQILDSVHGPLADAGLVLTTEVLERQTETRGKMNYTALLVRYTFHGEDGNQLASTVWAEATDAADKSIPKVMSAALKVLLIQVFTIPVNGDQADADAHTNDAVRTNDAPVEATREQLDMLGALLAEFQERSGGEKYPAAWVAEGYWPLPRMRREGCTVAAFEACAQITRTSIEAFDEVQAAQTAAPEGPEACPECKVVAPDHAAECSMAQF